jgi:hypothetical protein
VKITLYVRDVLIPSSTIAGIFTKESRERRESDDQLSKKALLPPGNHPSKTWILDDLPCVHAWKNLTSVDQCACSLLHTNLGFKLDRDGANGKKIALHRFDRSVKPRKLDHSR